MKYTILYGYSNTDIDKTEEVLYKCAGYVNIPELEQHSVEWANNNNYTLLRIDIHENGDIETILFN